MSTQKMTDAAYPGDDSVDVKTHAMAMITFISNRLSAGVAPSLREFMDLSVTEGRLIWLIGADVVDTAAEAVRVIGIDKAAISRSVNRLVEEGLVVSVPDQRHLARNLLMLTTRGKAYAKALTRLNDEREDRLLSVLTSRERASFRRYLAKILVNVEAANAVQPEKEWLGG